MDGSVGAEAGVAGPTQYRDAPLPPERVSTSSPRGLEENAGRFRLEVKEDSGSGGRIKSRRAPAQFSEIVHCPEQDLQPERVKTIPPALVEGANEEDRSA